ncbi:MAG: DNA primase, partial [Patescibacteria group bacterium]|nr:DNA primase [Patescibacteria group bacterium]
LIKEKIDIVEFIGQYITLSKAGKNWRALCPFHKEKTPSFMVSPERQSWRCFGCGAGGDIFSFLMKYENLEFGEALKILAERAGIELKKISPQEYKYIGLLYELQDLSKKFFVEKLETQKNAFKYLLNRGLKKETIEEFELGFAPAGPDELTVYLINLGFNPEDILRAGLAFKNELGEIRDRFCNRIIFPIHNHLGKIVGFTGRILSEFENENVGKYINSPESPIFKKSKILYGFWKSKNFIREKNSAFLVEGQMDFLMSWQAGVKNVCATSGTSLSSEQLNALKKISTNLIISFDTDPAGWEAGEKAIDLAQQFEFDVKIIVFDKFKDPAEAAASNEKNISIAIENALPAPKFYFKKYLESFNKDQQVLNKDYIKNIQIVIKKILNIPSIIERNFWIKKLAELTGLEEKYLIEEAERLKSKMKQSYSISENNLEQKVIKKFSRWEILSQEFIRAILAKNLLDQNLKEEIYLAPDHQKILNSIKKGVKKLEDTHLDTLLEIILLGVNEPESYNLEEIQKHLYQEFLKVKKIELSLKIKEAEKRGSQKELESALAELNNLLNLPNYN